MSLLNVVLLAFCAGLASCASTSGNTKSSGGRDIAAEVARICALPAGERENALEKLKQDSGMVLFCGSKE